MSELNITGLRGGNIPLWNSITDKDIYVGYLEVTYSDGAKHECVGGPEHDTTEEANEWVLPIITKLALCASKNDCDGFLALLEMHKFENLKGIKVQDKKPTHLSLVK